MVIASRRQTADFEQLKPEGLYLGEDAVERGQRPMVVPNVSGLMVKTPSARELSWPAWAPSG